MKKSINIWTVTGFSDFFQFSHFTLCLVFCNCRNLSHKVFVFYLFEISAFINVQFTKYVLRVSVLGLPSTINSTIYIFSAPSLSMTAKLISTYDHHSLHHQLSQHHFNLSPMPLPSFAIISLSLLHYYH